MTLCSLVRILFHRRNGIDMNLIKLCIALLLQNIDDLKRYNFEIIPHYHYEKTSFMHLEEYLNSIPAIDPNAVVLIAMDMIVECLEVKNFSTCVVKKFSGFQNFISWANDMVSGLQRYPMPLVNSIFVFPNAFPIGITPYPNVASSCVGDVGNNFRIQGENFVPSYVHNQGTLLNDMIAGSASQFERNYTARNQLDQNVQTNKFADVLDGMRNSNQNK